MSNTYVLGDVHGGKKAMEQVFNRSPFNPDEDLLICIGDVCDGWSEIPESFDLLQELPNLIYLWGNHDMWTFQGYYDDHFKDSSRHMSMWKRQGGQQTINAYQRVGKEKVKEHIGEFLAGEAINYHIGGDKAFMHAGFKINELLEEQSSPSEYFWNRDLFYAMHYNKKDIHINTSLDIKEIFVGHTPTINHEDSTTPITWENNQGIKIHFIDTGACYTGPLTLMDVNSKEYWQSDPVMELYPDQAGRNSRPYNLIKED